MKVNIFVACSSMLLVVVYLLVMQIDLDEGGDIAKLLPADSLIFLEQRNGLKALRNFEKSRLGKQLASIDFVDSGRKIGIAKDFSEIAQKLSSAYQKIKDDTIIEEILGKRFGVSILSSLKDQSHYSDIQSYLEDNAIVIAEPEHNAKLLQFFGENFSRYNDHVTITTAQYGDHHIKRINLGAKRISVVEIEGFFIMSINEKQLRRCIDVADGENPSLADYSPYSSIKGKIEKSDRFFFLPLD